MGRKKKKVCWEDTSRERGAVGQFGRFWREAGDDFPRDTSANSNAGDAACTDSVTTRAGIPPLAPFSFISTCQSLVDPKIKYKIKWASEGEASCVQNGTQKTPPGPLPPIASGNVWDETHAASGAP